MDKELLKEFIYLLERSADNFFFAFNNVYFDEVLIKTAEINKVIRHLYNESIKIIRDIKIDEIKYELYQILYFYVISFKEYKDLEYPITNEATMNSRIRELLRSCEEARHYLLTKYFSIYSATLYFIGTSDNFIKSLQYSKVDIGINYQNRIIYSPLKGSLIMVNNSETAEFLTKKSYNDMPYKHRLKYNERRLLGAIITVDENNTHGLNVLEDFFDYDTTSMDLYSDLIN